MGKQIKVTLSVYEKLKVLSRVLDMPMAQIINMMCNELLKKEGL